MAHEWVTDFLAALTLCPNVARACREAGVTRQAAYNHRNSDPDFARLWDEALEESTDELVGEAYRRAKDGVRKPVYQGGKKVGEVQEYSDTLAIFLLKCHRRKVYGDRLQADVTAETMHTHLYLPDNGRDGDRGGDAGPGDPPPAGPAGNVPLDPG